MAIPLDAAAAAMREAMRETVKRYSLWYLLQGALMVVAGVLAIVIGVLLLRQPESGLLLMTVLLIVFFMVEGISKIIFALTIKPFPNWGWVLASGLVGIVLAVYLWANMPVSAEWVLGILLGIMLISEGA